MKKPDKLKKIKQQDAWSLLISLTSGGVGVASAIGIVGGPPGLMFAVSVAAAGAAGTNAVRTIVREARRPLAQAAGSEPRKVAKAAER